MSGRLRRPDRVVVGVGGLAGIWSMIDLVALRLTRGDRVVVGVDGPFAGDQLQYLSWIRESGDHVLARNLYSGSIQRMAFLHPMFLLSGALWRAGVPLVLAFQIWKPVVVVALVVAYDAVVREVVGESRGPRLAALLLALFAASPLLAISFWGTVSSDLLAVGASQAASTTWGYLPATASLALLAAMFVLAGKALDWTERDGRTRRFFMQWAAIAGLLASWLHPWEGVIGVLVLAAVSMWTIRLTRSVRVLTTASIVMFATSAPLIYYVALARLVPAWEVSDHVAGQPPRLIPLFLVLGPFAGLAFAAGRGRDRTIDRIVRIWPFAAVGASLTLGTTAPTHFLASVSLPLAALAVEGWKHLAALLRLKAIAGAIAVLALIVPGSAGLVKIVIDFQSKDVQPHFLQRADADALSWLDHAPAGEVLTSPKLAPAVPALAGQPTWFGHPNWSVGFASRAASAQRLFNGQLTPDEATRTIAASGAHYVLVDCSSKVELAAILPNAVVHRFGCAAVFVRND